MDIHNYDGNHRRRLELLRVNNQISERNRELIIKFHDYLVLTSLSKPRLMKYLEILKLVAIGVGKDLDKATSDDLKQYVSKIQTTNYSPWTKQIYKVMIRRFYKWFYNSKDCPEIVNWISIRFSRSEKKLPCEGDLLTEKEVLELIKVADHPRDKALISILWESGARIGEIGTLCMKHVSFDKYGLVITVKGKTGSRKIRLITTTPYFSAWLSMHPLRENKDAPIFVNFGSRRRNCLMTYANIRLTLIEIFAKAGIKKRCNPHLFRHSRATYMANFLTEFQMNQYFGWIQGSDMPSTYVHMSGKEVDSAILRMNGIVTEESKIEDRKPKICVRCETINADASKFCAKCGAVLDVKTAVEIEENHKERLNKDEILNKLLSDKRVQDVLTELTS